MAVEIGRIGRWAGKNRIDCLNWSGKSRTDCMIVRFESRVVHAEASPTPDTPDLHGQTQQPEVCRGTRTAAIQSCRRMFFYHETRKNRFRRTQKAAIQSCRRMFFTTKHTKTGFVGHKRRLGKTSSPCFNHDSTSPRPINGRDGRDAILCARVHRSAVCGRAGARPSQNGQTLMPLWIKRGCSPFPADVDAPK